MRNRIPSPPARLILITAALVWAAPSGAQNLGHKLMGSLGLLAGSQPDSGLYILDQFASYGSNDLFDRNGNRIPVTLDLDAVANFTGFQVTFKLRPSMYMNVSAAAPFAQVSLQSAQPEASADTFGLGDVYVQPIKLGWKSTRMDIVTGYAFYAPTGLYIPRASGGVGLGQWTHEFSLGSAVYFDRAKTWSISALASYNLNQRKQGIDITRGDTVQIQGGAGKRLRMVNVGVAAYGLWQVRDDRGADLPEALRGAREEDLGLGPEIDITLARIRSRVVMRYCRDVVVKSRPSGQILVIGLSLLAHR